MGKNGGRGHWSNRLWVCPFFGWDERAAVHCEAGVIRLRDQRSINVYAANFCGGDWESCTLARALLAAYEREDKA